MILPASGSRCWLEPIADGGKDGALTTRPGALTNDFFVNLLDMATGSTSGERLRGALAGR